MQPVQRNGSEYVPSERTKYQVVPDGTGGWIFKAVCYSPRIDKWWYINEYRLVPSGSYADAIVRFFYFIMLPEFRGRVADFLGLWKPPLPKDVEAELIMRVSK